MEQNQEPRNKPTLIQLIYDKGDKNIQKGKESLCNKWYQENWTDTRKKKVKPDHLTSCTRISSKWSKHFHVGLKATKIVKLHIGIKSQIFIIAIYFF